MGGISRPERPTGRVAVSRALTGSGQAIQTSAKVNQNPREGATGVSCGLVSVVRLLDQLPEAVSQPPATLWSVFARSLGEHGSNGRVALAWRWALIGECASPVTLGPSAGRPPNRRDLLVEACAPAEPVPPEADPDHEVMHARLILRWLGGDLGALPLRDGRYRHPYAADSAALPHSSAAISDVHSWAMLAQWRAPWPGGHADPAARAVTAWAFGVVQLLDWLCGVSVEGPVTGASVQPRRPSLYDVSVDVQHAMVARQHALQTGDPIVVARMEAIMETFAWLVGWNLMPPVDRHGHGLPFECVERDAPCACDERGHCLRGQCSACWRVPCVYSFG
jgi:hypothetical protein